MNAFIRGLIAAVISCLATIYAVEGATAIFYAISIAGAVIIYFAQNALIKPITVFGSVDLRDVLKGLIMSVGVAVSTFAASLIVDQAFSWDAFFDVIKAALAMYLTKNLVSNSDNKILTPEKK